MPHAAACLNWHSNIHSLPSIHPYDPTASSIQNDDITQVKPARLGLGSHLRMPNLAHTEVNKATYRQQHKATLVNSFSVTSLKSLVESH
jgi:hypothetical protein